ncbi:hypothetical protein OG218_25305 [Kineococcus sp. NBC_00420]
MSGQPERLCVCGHPAVHHQHYRRGSDCSECDCPHYRRRDSLWRRLSRR